MLGTPESITGLLICMLFISARPTPTPCGRQVTIAGLLARRELNCGSLEFTALVSKPLMSTMRQPGPMPWRFQVFSVLVSLLILGGTALVSDTISRPVGWSFTSLTKTSALSVLRKRMVIGRASFFLSQSATHCAACAGLHCATGFSCLPGSRTPTSQSPLLTLLMRALGSAATAETMGGKLLVSDALKPTPRAPSGTSMVM
mmetsp:Transcript_25045/g.71837  ORF Transcript_25045/g.71837 Transcript_25045/m.71837 type:complete len:202 (+) Transcript_25045:2114-2719(+)